jgi:hypothetical protein
LRRGTTSAPSTIEEREAYRFTFGVLVAEAGQGRAVPLYAAAFIGNPWGRLDNFTAGGTGQDYPFEVSVTPYALGPQGRITPLADFDSRLTRRIADDTADSADAVRFAMTIAGSTFCRGGSVALNTDVGARINGTADLAAVQAASQAAGRDVIPTSVRGTAIPAVERLATSSGPGSSHYSGQQGWVVRLRCSLWRG